MRKKSSFLITTSLLCIFPAITQAAIEENPTRQNQANKSIESSAVPKNSLANDVTLAKEAFHPFTGKVRANRVRLRTQPNLEAHVVKELCAGDLFAVVGEDSDYYIVQPPKQMKGYVFRTFVLEDIVEGARVNVRLQPDTDSPVIGQLNSGDRIKGGISQQNSKWLEIDPPANARFYVAKEYLEKIGPVELIEKQEQRKAEASKHLNTALLFGQSELRKPFEEIDLGSINQQFDKLTEFADLQEIQDKAKETQSIIQETYIQKKIAFLESKADRSTVSLDNENNRQQALAMEKTYQQRLMQIGNELQGEENSSNAAHGLVASAANSLEAVGASISNSSNAIVANTKINLDITDKMKVWEPLEQSIYQIWASSNEEKGFRDFYEEEQTNATVLTGIIEPYSRPVKNRPGDFILRIDNLPVAFLYSTKINLQDKVGQKVTVLATPRPNNNFAFPAYYVLSIE